MAAMRGVHIGGAAAWAAAILVGLALGAASAWAALEFGRASFADQIGQWSYSRAAGGRSADPYTRAIIAREGLLALNACSNGNSAPAPAAVAAQGKK